MLSWDVDDAAYNADGTFAYPPYPRSADQVIAFWSKAQVPDATLTYTSQAYRSERAAWFTHRYAEWDKANPEPAKIRREAHDQWQREREGLAAQLDAERPASFGDSRWRPMVRLTRMYLQAQTLSDPERERVQNLEVTLPDGQVVTPAQLVERYDLTAIAPHMSDPAVTESLRLEALRQEMHGVAQAVENLQEQVYRGQ